MTINTGRRYHTLQTHYLSEVITYADDGETVSIGWLPPGAVVINAGVAVHTAFDGDTTNDLDIGYRNGGNGETDDTDEYASSISLATAGIIQADDVATAAVNYFANGAEIVGVVVSTASATAGEATVFVEYIVREDNQ